MNTEQVNILIVAVVSLFVAVGMLWYGILGIRRGTVTDTRADTLNRCDHYRGEFTYFFLVAFHLLAGAGMAGIALWLIMAIIV